MHQERSVRHRAQSHHFTLGEVEGQPDSAGLALDKGESGADCMQRAGNDTIVQILQSQITAPCPKLHRQGLYGCRKKQWPQGVSLLNAGAREHSSITKLQPGGCPVAPSSPASECREVGAGLGQYNLPANTIKSIAEIKLKEHLVRGRGVALHPSAHTVDRLLSTAWHRHTNLSRPEVGPGILPNNGHQAFACQSPQNFTDCDWSHATSWFWQSDQARTSQNGGNIIGGSSLGEKVDDRSQLGYHLVSTPSHTCFSQVLHTKARWARGRVWRELSEAAGNQLVGQFRGQGQVLHAGCCRRGRRMQGLQCTHSLMRLRKKSLRKQCRASLPVEALAPKSRSPFTLLRSGRCPRTTRTWQRARVPQLSTLTLLPALQAVKREGRRCLEVFASPARRWAKHSLRKHEELNPGAKIIAMCHCCQSAGKGLTPTVAGSSRYMTQSRRSGRLDIDQAGQLFATRSGVVRRSCRNIRSGPILRAASGMDASLLGDAQATNQAASFATFTKPTLRNFPFQRPAQMRINVILQHGSLADPAPVPFEGQSRGTKAQGRTLELQAQRQQHPLPFPGCEADGEDAPLRGVCRAQPVQGCPPRQTGHHSRDVQTNADSVH